MFNVVKLSQERTVSATVLASGDALALQVAGDGVRFCNLRVYAASLVSEESQTQTEFSHGFCFMQDWFETRVK